MPNAPGTVINGRWYAVSPYGPTNASGGVNLAPYGPWNGMPASGFSPVIGTPTSFTAGGTPQTPKTSGGGINIPTIGSNVTTTPGISTDFGLPTLPTSGGNASTGIGLSTGTPFSTAAGTSGAAGSFGTGPYQPGASPNLESITNLVNQLNLNAQQQANAGRVPGGQAVESTLMGDTAQLARGQLPQDVIDQIRQQSAERGVQTGNSDYLRALGLNSLQAQQTAQGNLSAAYARNPAAPIFDPTTQLLTPGQAGSLNNQQAIANAELQLAFLKAFSPGFGGGAGGGRGGGGTDPLSSLLNNTVTGALGYGGAGGQGTSLGFGGVGPTGTGSWFPLGGGTGASPTSGGIPTDPFAGYTPGSIFTGDLPDYPNPAGTTIDSSTDPFSLYG